MAGSDFGGHMRLRLASGANLVMRGSFSIGPSRYSIEAVTNDNGSVSRTAAPRPRTAEVTLEDDGTDIDALMQAPRQDIYVAEEFTGVSHVFTGAFFSGEPMVDRKTGEWTGITINANGYQRLGG
ncbi:hypothetical protein FHS55_002126 [Angulomicrobium tetraedrale]|uniref:Phage tail tube protein n=1 Tax=Ancylobacter tetraedralis TaxID=217068 RepID=A0A839Z9X6_9HYPH|nr:phage tail tube protein [Ancylobacter tetraedralis]MBB3771527.1 hypothetical protein [Ancylobacter tetraedralis]